MRYRLLASIVLAVSSGCARSARSEGPAAEMARPPKHDLQDIEQARDAFIARAQAAGIQLENPPMVMEWTRPSLISWRREKNAVAVPKWDELSKEQREMLANMAGSEDDAQTFFAWVFRWFLIPHELTHAIQEGASEQLDHARSERLANDVAAAFWMEQPNGPNDLDSLETVLAPVAERLPLPVPEGTNEDTWFNEHYDELANKPTEYGAFQVRYMLKSLGRRARLSLTELLASAK